MYENVRAPDPVHFSFLSAYEREIDALASTCALVLTKNDNENDDNTHLLSPIVQLTRANPAAKNKKITFFVVCPVDQ